MKIEEIVQRQNEIASELVSIEKKANELVAEQRQLTEKRLATDKNFLKANCPICNATGWIREENKKIVCPTCNGKCYIWVKKYKE